MASGRQADFVDIRAEVQSVVLDVLRRRANGELLPDEQAIAAHPDLAEDLRVELAKLQQICVAGKDAQDRAGAETATADMQSARTPGVIQIPCPHCREPFETARDTPVTDIICSSCGGHFSLAGDDKETRSAASLQTLAHFELVERLGVGGFGTVWKARDRKLDRTVAVKIPRQGMLNNDDLEKFLREARAAAQLQHPNIVRVYEVGRDGDSVFIVSDFVRGIPLNDWLTAQQPTMRQAAEICVAIATALQHAHDRGVIHRDLKPANVLIDGAGQPHLMDFGLAKRDVGEVTLTLDGQVLGTPAYMSPEQASGEAHIADGRSDIYSLGVILFELLTGELPFRGNARMLMHQVIHDEPPSPRKLNSNVPKDLETIALKCLEKEPTRRYQTAGELSVELNRYLAGEPIRARPIGRIARTWRWAKRRPAAAAVLGMLVLVAAGSTAAFIVVAAQKDEIDRQRVEAVELRLAAESERDNADAVVNFLTQDVLAKAAPEELQDKSVRDMLVKTLIEPAAASVGQQFDEKPLIEAAICDTLGQTLLALGRFDLALIHSEKALERRRKMLGEDHPLTITSLSNYAAVLKSLGRVLEAEPLDKQALEQRRKVLGADHPDTIESLHNYAYVLKSLGRAREAEPLSKQALEKYRKVLGEVHPYTITSLNSYALLLESLGRAREAEPLFEQALEQCRKVLTEDHPLTISLLTNYAYLQLSLGRAEEAEPLFKQALKLRSKVLGEDHPDTISSLNNYAAVLKSLGRAREAEPLYKRALEQYRKVLGEHHPDTITSLNNYAAVLKSLGRAQEAEPLYKQALDQSRTVRGHDHPITIDTLDSYAGVLVALRRAQDAELRYKQALEQSRKVLGQDHPLTIRVMSNYAYMLELFGRADEAEPLSKQALEQRRKVLGESHPDTTTSLNNYAAVLKALGREQETEPLYKQILEYCRKELGEDHLHTITSLNNYADVLESIGRVQEAEPFYKQALEQYRKVLGEDHPDTIASQKRYAIILKSLGRIQEAETLDKQLLDRDK